MLESLAGILKIFLEKHFISTVISLFVAGIIMLYIPDDSWIIKKLAMTGAYLLIATGCFLIAMLSKYLYVTFSRNRYWKKHRKELKIQNEKKYMEDLWSFVDGLGPENLKIINQLIKSENKPIEYGDRTFFSPSHILGNNRVMLSTQINRNGKMVKQYMLRPELYNSLKYSQEKYGRISHFQET